MGINQAYGIYLSVLRSALNEAEKPFSEDGDPSSIDWENVYTFFQGHAITALASDLIRYIPEEQSEIKKIWKESVYSSVGFYCRLTKKQEQILKFLQSEHIAVIVLKGTSAAKYYHKPQFRTMGDIDLLVKPEEYEHAVDCLIKNGCTEITLLSEAKVGRHRSFQYGGVSIELHHYFSSDGYKEKATVLDDLIFSDISVNSTVLSDDENGLVLLSHIRQHFKEGLGLRQIIDWMMFAASTLNDEVWFSSFGDKARKTGLETLAGVTTKMCKKYLGLQAENITWCDNADEDVCDDMMGYVLECGNFGRSRNLLRSSSVGKLPSFSHPFQLLKFLQSHGERNWKALKKYSWLKPFAWIYQSCRYVKLAFQNKVDYKKLKGLYSEKAKRNELFLALEIS